MTDSVSPSAPTIYTVSEAAIDAPPPSYDALFPQDKTSHNRAPPPPSQNQPAAASTCTQNNGNTSTQQASTAANGDSENVECGQKFAKAKFEPKFNIISLAIFIPLDIIGLILGAVYFNDCPFNSRQIPVFLIVYGIIAGIFHIMSFLEVWVFSVMKGLTTEQREQKKPGPAKCCGLVFALSGFGLFIYGCAITLGKQGSFSTDSSSEDYCHPTLFYFAFVMLAFSAAYLVFLFCIGIHIINAMKKAGK